MSRASTLAKAVGADGSVSTTGNTTLGDASTDTVTFNAATASIPNGLAFSNGNITLAGTFNSLTVGKGAGSVGTNNAIGTNTLASNTTGDVNTAVGYAALNSNVGGTSNTAVGVQALRYNASGNNNTALGRGSVYSNTTGNNNVGVGQDALLSNTTASNNTAVGYQAGYSNTTATFATLVGYRAGYSGVTASEITAVGYNALSSNTADSNSAFGERSLTATTTGNQNTGIGSYALATNTTGSKNVAVGREAGAGTTGSFNVAVGVSTLSVRTSGGNNVAVGHEAGFALTTGNGNVLVGYTAGRSTTGDYNTFVGNGPNYGAGYLVTSGSKNTILGAYNGNQGGLDIRTASNNIVLSDGDGNPRLAFDGNGQIVRTGTASLFNSTINSVQNFDAASRFGFNGLGNNNDGIYFGMGISNGIPAGLGFYREGSGWNTAIGFFTNNVTSGPQSTSAMQQKLLLTSSGALSLFGGATGPGGVGITFPATQVASSNANTLDDYEEGTWTPTVTGDSGGSLTLVVKGAVYTKIGNIVNVFWEEINWTANTLAGLVRIGGMPFQSRASFRSSTGGFGGSQSGSMTFAGQLVPAMDANTTSAFFIYKDPTNNTYSHTPTLGSSGVIYGFSFTYSTAN